MPLELPLLEQASQHLFTLLVKDQPLIPSRSPLPGEQYRFHFDMSRCIGCKCCVVACNEQNGNPAAINWRRVGELEGGVYPLAQRWHLSMGCNHCVEPSCMTGCPVEAYTKDPLTGIVDHSADLCIGCQYCTWNCSYGVPQFNAGRGVVGKCDMCHGRLSQGLSPACVNACPEGAIAIEIVNLAEWRWNHESANAPGLPSAEDSLSTTRVTLPANMSVAVARVDSTRVAPEHPHWSLVLVLVLTQLSVGGFLALWLAEILLGAVGRWAALLPLAAGIGALAAAPLHLGRPAFAYRAVRNWKHSWLSREILGLSLFAAAATLYAAALYLELPARMLPGAAAVIAGLIGVTCSARIYMVPARPAWNLPHTMAAFHLTAVVLGTRVLLATGIADAAWMTALGVTASLVQLSVAIAQRRMMRNSAVPELRASAQLLAGPLRTQARWSIALYLIAALALPVSPALSCGLALIAEITSRWLFFTSVVPKSVASTFLTPGVAA